MKSIFKSEEDFNQFFDNKYNDVISEYYDSYKNRRKNIIISKVIFGVILSIFFIIITNVIELNEYAGGFAWIIDFFLVAVIFACTIASIYSEIKEDMIGINDDIIKDILAFISDVSNDKIEHEPHKMVSRSSLNEAGLFNLDVVEYNGKNFTKVPYYKNNMVFSDICTYVYDIDETQKEIYKNGKKYLRTIKTKKKKFLFEGMYIGATMNKKSQNQIYLIPNNISDKFIQSKIKNYISFRGYDIVLENAEFSKKYKVFCDDEIQARYILSMSLMERINKVDDIIKGKKYIVFKEGKRFTMCIEGLSIEKIKRNTLPTFPNKEKERKVLLKIFNELNNLLKIYHILDLGNDLYTKYNVDEFISTAGVQGTVKIDRAQAESMATISFKAKE